MFIAILKENRNLYFYSFYSMAILNMLFSEYPGELAPCLMLFIALLYNGSINNLIMSIAIIPSALVINSFYSNFGNLHTLPIGIIGNVGILLFLYFAVIRQPSRIDHLAKVTPLTHRQLIILKYLSIGISRKKMPGKVPERELWKYEIDKFSFDIINAEIAKIKNVLDIDSEFCLGIWYNKKTVVE